MMTMERLDKVRRELMESMIREEMEWKMSKMKESSSDSNWIDAYESVEVAAVT